MIESIRFHIAGDSAHCLRAAVAIESIELTKNLTLNKKSRAIEINSENKHKLNKSKLAIDWRGDGRGYIHLPKNTDDHLQYAL